MIFFASCNAFSSELFSFLTFLVVILPVFKSTSSAGRLSVIPANCLAKTSLAPESLTRPERAASDQQMWYVTATLSKLFLGKMYIINRDNEFMWHSWPRTPDKIPDDTSNCRLRRWPLLVLLNDFLQHLIQSGGLVVRCLPGKGRTED